MNLYDKQIIVFPEYHLSDFPPQISYTQSDAQSVLEKMNMNVSDIIISGYTEKFEDALYSSCLILDGSKVYNVRKRHPYIDEKDYIRCWDTGFQHTPLSIGNSYFFICNDVSLDLDKNEFTDYVKENDVSNFFFISAMGMNFDKHLSKLKAKAMQLRVKHVVYCDRFHGKGLFNTYK